MEQGMHRNAACLFLQFSYDFKFKEYVKGFPGMTWSKTHRCFYVEYSALVLSSLEQYLQQWGAIRLIYREAPFVEHKEDPNPRVKNLPKDKEELLRFYKNYLQGKRYSDSTLRVYSGFINDFLRFHKNEDPETLDGESVRLFIEWVVAKYKYSISTHRQLVSALKHFAFFYPNCSIDPGALSRPKRPRKLPVVLSMEEVMRLLQVTRNLKHKAIIALLYSSGLRIGELIDLKLNAFDFERKQLHVKYGKGKKDRYTQLADSVLPLLKTYYDAYAPKDYFIEGQGGGKYSATSVRAFLKQNCKLAGITKPVSPHTLRHSYATHLLESGTGLRFIQELLGHSKPETTMVYTHVSSQHLADIRSPLDVLVQKYRDTDTSYRKLSFGQRQVPDNNNKT